MATATKLSIGSAANTASRVSLAVDLFLTCGPRAYKVWGRSARHSIALLLAYEFYQVEEERVYWGTGYSPDIAERLLCEFEMDSMLVREAADNRGKAEDWPLPPQIKHLIGTAPRLRRIADTIAALLDFLVCFDEFYNVGQFDSETAKDILGNALHSLLFGSNYGSDSIFAITDCQGEYL
jgi:hypothetical protein